MSEISPEAPEQIRGETLTPVSPKPLHYPSPSNIPILEASMDPAFSDTVTQTMQQQSAEPLPSVAQHTIPTAISNTAEPSTHDNDTVEDTAMAGVQAAGASVNLETALPSMSDPASEAQETLLQGQDPTPSEAQPSETTQDPTAVDTSPSAPPEDASIDVAADTAAESQPAAPQDVSSLPPKPVDTPNAADGSVDYSALLANLSNVIASATPSASGQPTPAPAQAPGVASSPTPALPNNPNLPPKPPAQEKPSIHPNYVPGEDLRSYHPHTQKDSVSSYQPAGLPNLNTNGLPPPPLAYQTPQSAAPISAISAQASQDDEDAPFDPQTQALYDQFIAFERQNVHDGQWDKFPMGSRLFVGNLSTEKVQKKDVFRKFYRYGQIAQISLKQAYGFVQFMDAATCATALAMEQATKIRGREIHLEVSKPAKSTNRGQNDRNRRRSRSPDYSRGAGAGGGRVDRYSGSPRDRDNRRSRDDWRRSPSPRRGYGGRDDRYDGRRRRSPSPYDSRDRYGAPPQRDEFDLPWRQPGQIPDVQILVVDQIDEQYIRWVDNAMKSRGVRVDVLMLQPRWSEEAVVRRQVMEGVTGVVHLYRADRMKNKVPLRLFNRSGGANNVSFDQYVDLDPTTAADLVLRAKQTQPPQAPPPPQQQYGMPPQQRGPPPPQYNNYPPRGPPPPQQAIPPPSGNPADISRIMSSLSQPSSSAPTPANNADLARLMAGMNPQQGGRPGSTGITPDVARLLGQMGQPPQGGSGQPMPAGFQNPPTTGPPSVQPPNQQSSTDIAQLLANLTNYKAPS